MAKYIDAELLREEIEKVYKSEIQPWLSGVSATSAIYDYVLPLIDSLQQEQLVKSELKEEKIECSPVMTELIGKLFEVGHAYNFGFGPKDFLQEQPESSKGKFVFPNYLYARTMDNKTIDVSYVPQSLDAVEYIKNNPTEQPEMDLEEEVCNYLKTHHLHIKDGGRVVFDNDDSPNFMCDIRDIARHFYDFGCRRTAEKYDEIEYNRQRAEESVPNDLEEAAVDIADALLSKPKDYALSAKADYWNGVHDGTIAGAKWQKEQMISALKNDGDLPIEFIDKFHEIDRTAFQNGQANMKEQMMKDAVEGVVFGNVYEHWVETGIDEKLSYLNPGDKVRVIIVKEDEK